MYVVTDGVQGLSNKIGDSTTLTALDTIAALLHEAGKRQQNSRTAAVEGLTAQ